VTTPRLPGAFWRLWAAGAVSNLGDGVLLAAMPLMAAQVADSRLSVGLVSAFVGLPWLLFALPVGSLLDRVDRRRVMVLADTARALMVAALAVVAAAGDVHVWMLWVLAFGLGLGEVFFDSASQAVLPAVVPTDALDRANGLRQAAEIAGNTFLGVPLGGLLFAAAVWLPFGTDAASFAIAAATVASLSGRFTAAAPDAVAHPEVGTMATWRADIAHGFRQLWRQPMLRHLVVALSLLNLAFAMSESTFVLFARDELGIGTRGFGVLLAVVGAGSIVASMVGGWVVQRVGRRFAMIAATVLPVLSMAAVGLVPVTWWVVLMVTVQAAMVTVWSVLAVTLRQQIVPAHEFGRVNAVFRWCSWGAMPLGAALGGVVASTLGLRAPWFAAAALVLLAVPVVVTAGDPPPVARD
jgi:MFS family permease